MIPEGSTAPRRVAVGFLGRNVSETALGGDGLTPSGESMVAELIADTESIAEGLRRIKPDCLMLVYRGFDSRLAIPVDIGVPTYLVFDADGLTGYSRPGTEQRLLAERGLALLRSLAPSVSLAIAPSQQAASYLRATCGFGCVTVAGEATTIQWAAESDPAVPSDRGNGTAELGVRVEGPFDSTYSLAVVNAGLALGLADLEAVTCTADVAPTDQVAPSAIAMLRNPTIAKLWTDSRHAGRPDAVIRNCYPPLPEGIDASGRFLYFFWEDSLISPEWAQRFNDNLTGVLAPTRHVETVLRDSGVEVPVGIVPCGIHQDALSGFGLATSLPTSAGFRFLHISSGFPRKGVDVLLDAYFAEFSATDDVCLVLKTFENIHNTTAEHLAMLRREHPAGPEVVSIERELPDYQYLGLYRACDCFVSATRCEGFGLPMAEAMAFGIPVIVTDYSGHLDFCDDQTAYMIESTLVDSASHFKVPGAKWAEPSVASLRSHMRYVFENRAGSEVEARVARARARAKLLTWANSAQAAADFVRSTMES